ncbi:MAG: FAD-dependent oxidoreductase [Mariprofundaceae bacterium]
MSHKQCDILIVGAGLAGSLLAYTLKQAGKNVLIINDPELPSASRVAAGLINPVTGKRLVLQHDIHKLLPFAHDCYHQLEKVFSKKILTHKPMLRVMRSEKEHDTWRKRCHDVSYAPFLGEETSDPSLHLLYDAFLQHQTSFLDTNALLDMLKQWFEDHHGLIESAMHYEEISLLDDGVCWNNISAKRMVFCEGWRGQDNPWFKRLPFQPVKGEILTMKSDEPMPDIMLNWGKWFIPMGDGIFKTGATYDRDQLDERPTKAARDQLINSLDAVWVDPLNKTMVEHQAGVRPGTRDKQPFVGMHAEAACLGIFNGFGSKGSLLIPWYAKQFSDYLYHGKTLPSCADIKRFSDV